jgi:hypothetical protein
MHMQQLHHMSRRELDTLATLLERARREPEVTAPERRIRATSAGEP